LIYP
jgi:hypothetical protein